MSSLVVKRALISSQLPKHQVSKFEFDQGSEPALNANEG